MRIGRSVVAVVVTAIAAPLGVWACLLAVGTMLSQVLAGFGVAFDADWVQLFNPAVWFGVDNVAGNGSALDALVGGAGAPGGTFGNYVRFMLLALLASGCWFAVRGVWTWARQ